MYDDTLGKNGLWKVTVDGTGAKGKALQGKN
jgi:hypothetical protein